MDRVGVVLVRYYFTVQNGRTYPDNTGYTFDGPDEAIGYAKTLAAELDKEPALRDSRIVVRDERGLLVAEIAVAATRASSGANAGR